MASISSEHNEIDQHFLPWLLIYNTCIKSSTLRILKSTECDENVFNPYSRLLLLNTIISETPSSPSMASINSERDEVVQNPYSWMLYNFRIKSETPSRPPMASIRFERDEVGRNPFSWIINNFGIKSETPSSSSAVSISSKSDKINHDSYSHMIHNTCIKSSASKILKSFECDENFFYPYSWMIYNSSIKTEAISSSPIASRSSERDEADQNSFSWMIYNSSIKSETPSSLSMALISSERSEVDQHNFSCMINNSGIQSKPSSSSSKISRSTESDEVDHGSHSRMIHNTRIRARTKSSSSSVTISSESSEVDRDSYPQMSRKIRHKIRSPSSLSRMSKSTGRTNKFNRCSSPRMSRKIHRISRSPKRKVIIQNSSSPSSWDRHRSLNRYNYVASNNRRSPKRSHRRSRSPPSPLRYCKNVETISRRSRPRSYSTYHERYFNELYYRPHLSDIIYDRPLLHPSGMIIPRKSSLSYVTSMYPYFGSIHPTFGPRQMFPLRLNYSPYPLYNNNDKYPDYLSHIRPEDDPSATRTLFVGNLETSMSLKHLRYVFSRYGTIEDIDLKVPLPDAGNAFAFVQYQNLDMAFAAKVQISGQYMGKLPCKIGYGKRMPTKRVWVGGLCTWTTSRKLKQEFSSFGVIKEIQYTKGDTCAYITYESTDAAMSAASKMRGVHLKVSLHKLKTDFADEEVCTTPRSKSTNDDLLVSDNHSLTNNHKESEKKCKDTTNDSTSLEYSDAVIDLTGVSGNPSADDSSQDSNLVFTFNYLVEGCINVWQSSFLLKEQQYLAKCHLITGHPKIIEKMVKDNGSKGSLRIDQRLHLIKLNRNQPKEIYDLIMTTENKTVFLAIPCPASPDGNENIEEESDPSRHLRCLINLLTSNMTTGIVPYSQDKQTSSGIYVFPPCEYSVTLIQNVDTKWSDIQLNGDYLVIVVVTKSNDDTSEN